MLFIAVYYFTVETDHVLPADGHLLCFYFLAVLNAATMSFHVQDCLYMFLFHLDDYIGVELQDHIIMLCLATWGTAKLFSKVTAGFSMAPAVYLLNFLSYRIYKYFLSIYHFLLLWCSLKHKVFSFDEIQIISFFFCCLCSQCLRNQSWIKDHIDFSSKIFVALSFTFQSSSVT